MAVTFRSFGGWRDALAVRRIRNAAAASMTRDTGHVGLLDQWRWRRAYRREAAWGRAAGWVWVVDGRVVGYGLARYEGGRWWLSGAVDVRERRRGYGRAIFLHLVQWVHGLGHAEVWLEVRAENTAACWLYLALGFEVVETRRGILTMVKRESRPLAVARDPHMEGAAGV